MSASVVAFQSAVPALGELDAAGWRAHLVARLEAGARPVTLFGRGEGDEVRVTAVLQAGGALEVTRGRLGRATGYHELTSRFPAVACFERELHEQTQVRVAGHPWLKPIRFEGQTQAAMAAYPYYRVEGKEVHEVAVGPIHAGVIEPGSFRFMCLGEQVHHLEIQLGYQHRGVERRLLERDARRQVPLVETVAGDSSVAHAWAYCAALEALAGFEASDEVELARAVMLELERVAMHLASLSGLAADIGHLQGATTYGRLRTTAINTSMRLCGSRFGRGAVRAGGSGVTLDAERRDDLRKGVALLRDDLALIDDCFLSAQTVRHRLVGVGALSEPQACELGLVGLAARACGVPLDMRQHAPGVWKRRPLPLVTQPSGDCWARAVTRVEELRASLAWLAAVAHDGPALARSRSVLGPLAAGQLAVAAVEGWRGEVVYGLETNDRGELISCKVQDPSLRNWVGLARAVRGNEISDFPICNKSFDLSYCGNDL